MYEGPYYTCKKCRFINRMTERKCLKCGFGDHPQAEQATASCLSELLERGGDKHQDDSACCSFCGKDREEVFMLVASKLTYICDECVFGCMKIMHKAHVMKSKHYDELCEKINKMPGAKTD